jgi:hypothetical protein
MKRIVLNVLVFVACVYAGGLANGLIIQYSDAIIPAPVGIKMMTVSLNKFLCSPLVSIDCITKTEQIQKSLEDSISLTTSYPVH